MNTALIKPKWSFATIALMVIGFVVFWPLGLAVLAYILWGECFGGSSEKAGDWLSKQKQKFTGNNSTSPFTPYTPSYGEKTGNAAFDEYRAEQIARLDAERRRLEEERAEFEAHLAEFNKAKDREEFERFMQNRKKTSGAFNPEKPFNT